MLTLRKRGDVWYCRGTVRVGEERRQVKEHTTGCREPEDAEQYRDRLTAELRQELLDGAPGRQKRMTFFDCGHEYLDRPGGLAAGDAWRIGELNEVLGDFTVAHMEAGWRDFMAKRCTGLAPATVERFRATLQAALNHALGKEAPRIPPVRFKNTRVRFLTVDEQEALLAAYVEHVRPIALTLCFQGCRTQEALRLRRRDVDLGRGTLYFPETKNGLPRTVAIHPRVRAAVEPLCETLAPDDHVFRNRFDEPYGDTRRYRHPGGNPLAKAHATACRRAKITDFRVHDWRHHWASRLVMAGVDFRTIMDMGGWKSGRMLERYVAVSDDHMADAIRKLV